MKPSRWIAPLFVLLAAGVPALAFAAPPKPGVAKKAPVKQDGGVGFGLAVLGLAVVGGGFAVYRARSRAGAPKGDGRAPEPIVAERKHDWELRLTEPQEAAMLRGIQAYRDGGHSLYVGFGDAIVTFYEPRMLVSLHRITDGFLAAGPAADADPVGAVRAILDGFVAAESQGVLHLRKGWCSAPIDGLDHLAFTRLCHDLLTCPQPYVEGMQGSYSDENSGGVTVNVQVDGPINTFCVDLGRVLPLVRQARAARPSEPLAQVIRPVLQGMCRGEIAGSTWTRGTATPAEVDLLVRVVATSAPRAA